MATYAAEYWNYALGSSSDMSHPSFFHTACPVIVHLSCRLRLLIWTSEVVQTLRANEFFLGDDFNCKDQMRLHSGGKQHLVRLSVSHAALEHLLQHRLLVDQLRQGRIVLDARGLNPACFGLYSTQDGERIRQLTGLPPALQIVLVDFGFPDWTTVNRVYVKPDLLQRAFETDIDIPHVLRTALMSYMRHFREMARDGVHLVYVWVATFDFAQQKNVRFDTNQYARAPADDEGEL